MCGIVGLFQPRQRPTDDGLIERMTESLRHRGPDASGIFRDGPTQLGHRRLSVIDLAASRQPMLSTDRSLALVFNGEIYNFRELRAKLQAGGRDFLTNGDTEVVLAAYEAYGDELVQHLDGMFALAVWDRRRGRLLLARDHMGVKPLYYAPHAGGVVFASELKAIELHPDLDREIDMDALGMYLECQYVPGPRSIYSSVRKLPPAHMLAVEDGRCEEICYWRTSYAHKVELSEDETVDAVDETLTRSVESMLVADVPLGIFVSGGVDSSLIAALACKVGHNVDTFNLGFGETEVSEHREAQRVADHVGTKHHVLHIEPRDVLGELDRFLETYDEPFGDQAALPTLLLSRLTRRHVTVVLSGEGADEIFGGYRSYKYRLKDEAIARWLAWPLRGLAPLLPSRLQRGSLIRSVRLPPAERYRSMPRIFEEETHEELLTPTFLAQRTEVLRNSAAEAYRSCDAAEYLDCMLHVDTKLWLPEDLLTKVDRATMAYSLEARVPYLDRRVVELAASLPPSIKVTRAETKIVLKRVAERYLPHDIIHRRKQGFSMPLDRWLREDLKDRIDDALGEGGLARRGIVRRDALERLVTEQRNGKKGLGMGIWVLFALEQWFRRRHPDFKLT